MAAKVAFALMLNIHGANGSEFSMTWLASFEGVGACNTAMATLKAALGTDIPADNSYACFPADELEKMMTGKSK